MAARSQEINVGATNEADMAIKLNGAIAVATGDFLL